jgi:hypothetical protein
VLTTFTYLFTNPRTRHERPVLERPAPFLHTLVGRISGLLNLAISPIPEAGASRFGPSPRAGGFGEPYGYAGKSVGQRVVRLARFLLSGVHLGLRPVGRLRCHG